MIEPSPYAELFDTGLLVPVDDDRALAAAVLHLIDEPDLADKLGRRGRERLLKEYSPDVAVSAYRNLLEQLGLWKRLVVPTA